MKSTQIPVRQSICRKKNEFSTPKLLAPLSLLTLVAAPTILSLLIFWPGWMTNDSFAQLEEALNASYRNWHPVFFSWWWRNLILSFGFKEAFLVQNVLVYWLAWYFIADATVQKREMHRLSFSALMAICFGFVPCVFPFLAMYWKDVVFAVSMSLAWCLLIKFDRKRILFAFLLTVLAVGVKPNGIVVCPILWAYIFGKRKIFRIGLATSITFMVSSLPSYFNAASKPKQYQYMLTYDLMNLSNEVNQYLLPSYIAKRDKAVSEKFPINSDTNDNNFWSQRFDGGTLDTDNDIDLKELRTAWLRAVFKYPWLYMKCRIKLVKSYLRISVPISRTGLGDNDIDNGKKPTFFYSLVKKFEGKYPFFFKPWIQFLLLAFLVIFSYSGRAKYRWLFYYQISGFVFFAPHLFILPAADYRYGLYSLCVIWHGLGFVVLQMVNDGIILNEIRARIGRFPRLLKTSTRS